VGREDDKKGGRKVGGGKAGGGGKGRGECEKTGDGW